MFDKQVNRILNKVKKANVLLGTPLSREAITRIQEDLNIDLPLSYVTYLSKIQNIGLGEITTKKPQNKASIISQNFPKMIEQQMLNNLEIKQKFETDNILNNTIPLNHIHLNRVEPNGNGPYYGIYSLNTALSTNIKSYGRVIKEEFPFEKDLDFGEIANEGKSLKWEEHLNKLKTVSNYASTWDRLEEKYAYNPKWLAGTIPICDYGCGDEFILVINGKNRGEVWVNSLPSVTGIYSLKVNILTFFENWLDDKIAIQKGQKKELVNAYYSFLEFGKNDRYKIVEENKNLN